MNGSVVKAARPPLLGLLGLLAGIDGFVTLVLAFVRLTRGTGPEGAPWWDSMLAIVLGLLLVVAAAGLGLGRPWGRWTATAAFGLALVLQAFTLLSPLMAGEPASAVALSLRGLALTLLLAVVIYLNLRPAAAWFDRDTGRVA